MSNRLNILLSNLFFWIIQKLVADSTFYSQTDYLWFMLKLVADSFIFFDDFVLLCLLLFSVSEFILWKITP